MEWHEDLDGDDDGDFSATLTIISSDPALIKKARRMFRSLMDDTPSLASVPRRSEGDE